MAALIFKFLQGVVMMTALAANANGVPGQVSDLGWMAGDWTGPIGEDTLEEHWMPPSADNVIGSVRITAGGSTRMLEFIVIEQVNDSLLLRVQQWLPGMTAVYDAPQVMTLKEIGEHRVVFESAGGFTLSRLGYSRPQQDRFVIDAELAAGGRLELELQRR